MLFNDRELTFFEELQHAFFRERDLNKLLTMLAPDIIWTGIGDAGIGRGIEQAAEGLFRDFKDTPERFIVISDDTESRRISKMKYLICSNLVVCTEGETDPSRYATLYVSMVCRDEGGRLLLEYMHMSSGDDKREKDTFSGFITEKPYKQIASEQQDALKLLNEEFTMLMDIVPGGVLQCLDDESLNILNMNEMALAMFGYTREEIASRFLNSYAAMIHPEDMQRMTDARNAAHADPNGRFEIEYRVLGRNGEPVWVMDKGRVLADQTRSMIVSVIVDISKLKEKQRELSLSLERHEIIMDQAQDIIFEWDVIADEITYSANWQKRFGTPPRLHHLRDREWLSKELEKYLHKDDISSFMQCLDKLQNGAPFAEFEMRLGGEGNYCWYRMRGTNQFDENGHSVKVVGIIVDVDDEKKESQALLQKAETDGLSGVYNKTTVQRMVEQLVHEGVPGAMLIIDIDDFKAVNDTFGHPLGDTVIINIADQLKKQFRNTDLIGRIGGDEFMIYMRGAADETFLKEKVEALVGSIGQVKEYGEKSYPITCSIGVARFPQHASTFEELYRKADAALYQAKVIEQNSYLIYDEQLEGNVIEIISGTRTAVSDRIDSDMTRGS